MNKRQLIIGLLIGLISNIIVSTIYTYFISNTPIWTTIKFAKENGSLSSIVSLGALPNLIFFFLFLKRRQDTIARGLLLATIITAFLTLAIKFS